MLYLGLLSFASGLGKVLDWAVISFLAASEIEILRFFQKQCILMGMLAKEIHLAIRYCKPTHLSTPKMKTLHCHCAT